MHCFCLLSESCKAVLGPTDELPGKPRELQPDDLGEKVDVSHP